MAKSYETLDAWKEAVELAVAIYDITAAFPKSETFGMTSQIRRSAISVSSNIAEGCGRRSLKERKQFFGIALGSLNETESLLIVANRLRFINDRQFELIKVIAEKEGRLLGGLLKHVSRLQKEE
ncbi:MAG: four helix bundle protein [Deltaproteobacteria bacterium]|nr:four helix bundle protein [Deltaproteobacteria bacterium]